MRIVSRRVFLAGAAGLATVGAIGTAVSQPTGALPPMLVNKDPSCGCCEEWVAYVRAAGFQAKVVESRGLASLKARLGVPGNLQSCHTAEIGGYVLEGHVPASAIKRLLAERPTATGLAVPGMPIGSPGMEVKGAPDDTYDVILFGPSGEHTFARFQGGREL